MKNTIRSRSSIESFSTTAGSRRPSLPDSPFRTPLPRASFLQSNFLRLSSAVLCSILAASAGWSQSSATQPAPGEPDYKAPWPAAEKKGLWPKSTPAEATKAPASEAKPVAPAKPTESTAETKSTEAPPPGAQDATAPPPALSQTRARNHELAFSADYFFGQGDVSMPVFFSLEQTYQSAGLTSPFTPAVVKPDRESSYYGGTISYSYKYAWYVDLSYQHGSSSGSLDLDYAPGTFPPLPSEFQIDDNWYQAYVRYAFPGLRRGRFSAYVRAGVSYVDSEMTDSTVFPNIGSYNQTDKTKDLLGNLGFGVGYSLYSTRRMRVGLQLEGEGFFGSRSQESLESLAGLSPSVLQEASIDNTLYGGIGRGTVRFEYRLGHSGFFRIFADAGMQAKFTEVNYPDTGNFSSQSFGEILWGPYVKLGARYSF